MSARERGAARRYAQALFDLALERGQAAEVRTALAAAQQALAGSRELRSVLLNPAVSGDKKKAIVTGLWPAGDGAAGLVARLLALLAARHRVAAIERIAELYGALWNAHRQVLSAELLSAVPLDAGQLAALRDAVRGVTGRDVELKTAVDENILGGLRLIMDGRVYDGTVRARLTALRARLAAAGQSA